RILRNSSGAANAGRQVAVLQATQIREAAGVLEPAPNVLLTTLENSHSGYVSLKIFATECSKLPHRKSDFVTSRPGAPVKEITF
ncbi:MAG: hypothetical protein ACRDPL_17200, partial [Propionibacteriaceae bacterium]